MENSDKAEPFRSIDMHGEASKEEERNPLGMTQWGGQWTQEGFMQEVACGMALRDGKYLNIQSCEESIQAERTALTKVSRWENRLHV